MASLCRRNGRGYKATWKTLKDQGFSYSREEVQHHCAHVERSILSAVGEAEDRGTEVGDDFFQRHGIDLPPEGTQWVAATVEQRGEDGEKHWVRIKPEGKTDRVEMRQAMPVEIVGTPPPLVTKSSWQVWAVIPDCQIGYWQDREGRLHTTHDEQAFSLGHQIMATLAQTDGLHGILDVGDYVDLSAASRWDPTSIDSSARVLNETWQRSSEELARRRSLVGAEGEVVVLGGNHDRLRTFFSKAAPWVVGMQRPGDTTWPVMSVPYLVRAADYGVEWCEHFPGAYRKLNSNLVAMHSPALGSKPLDTAHKIASTIHASVVHGHTHRSESASFNLETTDKGVRTFSVFSSGCWARIDGSLPSGKNSIDSWGDRLLANPASQSKIGFLSENFHQGMDILWVETSGKERWSREHVDFWGGWAQWRGMEFQAQCDLDGTPLGTSGRGTESCSPVA